MENTPLQLYVKAYNLHYEENNFNEARSIYRQLINDYHGSDIADYASIQLSELSKLQNEKNEKTTPPHQNKFNIVLIVFIVINFILIGGIIAFFGNKLKRYNDDLSTMSKISQVYAKLYAGKENDAFKILNEVKIKNRGNITPYAIAADIHLKNHDFVKAKNEYEVYQNLSPDNTLDKDAIKYISMVEELYKLALAKSAVSEDTEEDAFEENVEVTKKIVVKKKRADKRDAEATKKIIIKKQKTVKEDVGVTKKALVRKKRTNEKVARTHKVVIKKKQVDNKDAEVTKKEVQKKKKRIDEDEEEPKVIKRENVSYF